MAKRQLRAPSIAPFGIDTEEWLRKNTLPVVNALLRGKANNTFDLTLSPGESTTLLVSDLVTLDSVIELSPQTASAAEVVWWVEPLPGRAVIHHDVSEAADRTFGVVVHG